MTHNVHHQYDELIPASLPGLEIHVVYDCESEITFDEDGNEKSNRLTSIRTTVDGLDCEATYPFPFDHHGKQAREFLALLRESARQALWLEQKKTSGLDDNLRTFAQIFGKPEKDLTA